MLRQRIVGFSVWSTRGCAWRTTAPVSPLAINTFAPGPISPIEPIAVSGLLGPCVSADTLATHFLSVAGLDRGATFETMDNKMAKLSSKIIGIDHNGACRLFERKDT